MFERFTDRARRVVVLSQEEARLLGHNYIGTEHLLLGLLHEGEGVAAMALERSGLTLEGLRADVEGIIGRGQQAPPGHIPFTPRCKKVLELALREGLQLGHNYIGTEHLLLALLRVGEGVAFDVLTRNDLDLNAMRRTVIEILHAHKADEPAESELQPETLAGTRYTEADVRRILGGKLKSAQALVTIAWESLHRSGPADVKVASIYEHIQVPSLPENRCVEYADELDELVKALIATGLLRRKDLNLERAVRAFVQNCLQALDIKLFGEPDPESEAGEATGT